MIVDHALIMKVETAMAAERSAFADGMATLRPDSGAAWLPVAGGRGLHRGRPVHEPGSGAGAAWPGQP